MDNLGLAVVFRVYPWLIGVFGLKLDDEKNAYL